MSDSEQTLRHTLDKILDRRKYTRRDVRIKEISSGGSNFTSALFLVDVTAPDKEDLKLFAKVGCIKNEMRKIMNADWLYNTERYVYTELIGIYEKIQDEHNIKGEKRFAFPKFYGYNAEVGKETIVVENLTEAGYRSFNRHKCVDWDTARVSVENLAKFHALSFAFERKYPEKFNRDVPNMKFRMGSDEEDKDNMKPVWIKMVEGSVSSLEGDQKEKVLGFLMNEELLKMYNKPNGKPVICHGDYRLSNLLFKGQGENLTVHTVDFQTVYGGCPASDLIYFIFLGSDEAFRDRYYQKLLDHYYSSLEEALRRLDIEPVDVYPKEKFDSDIKQVLPFAVLLGVIILPIITVEAQNAPRVDGDLEDFILEPTELYAQRFRGIVNDCFKLGAFE
ncbi:uncharacterized protein LOC121737057 [Aricia agestis]|uniref:uncharacterized protein LOC121737057 n=1 Tax=Aricia agestis TaxID=91739 RepID=UPI001C202AD3|nr:uncharacterized protein LOC121737057 [Aricia agestis]